jgi:hypothetical protein
MSTLLTIVTLYPSQLITKQEQIEDVLIDKICDLKIIIRQIADKILRALQPTHSKSFLKRILTKLNNCSIIGK